MMRASRGQAGLTLIEIMVVLVIIGIVMGFIGSRVLGAGDKAKAKLTKIRLQEIAQAIEEYRLEYNVLPRSIIDLTQCNEQTGPGCIPSLKPDQIEDAWGGRLEYRLENGNRAYQVLSFGSDGRSGGTAVNADISIKGP